MEDLAVYLAATHQTLINAAALQDQQHKNVYEVLYAVVHRSVGGI